MLEDTCRLCLEHAPLCRSHALPNALFRPIFQRNEGKAIHLVDDEHTPNHYSSDSWSVELLCTACEKALNDAYDSYGISVVKGKAIGVYKSADAVTFLKLDRRRLRAFFLSLLWRFSVSRHDSYLNVQLPKLFQEELRIALLHKRHFPQSRVSVLVSRLRDSSPSGALSQEDLRELIMSPFQRQNPRVVSVCFLFMGLFIEVHLASAPRELRGRAGLLDGTNPVLRIPYVEFLDVPEIAQVLVRGVGKYYVGNSHVD